MTGPPTDHRRLRSALEFAVLIAREGMKRRPPLPIPDAMKRFTKSERLPAASLGPVRRVVEAEDEFRRVLAIAATSELVDEIGLVWLQRPDGWEAIVEELEGRADRAEAEAEEIAEARRERRRREAAEAAAARSRTEVVAATARAEQSESAASDALARIEELESELASLRAALSEARTEARHARDREQAAVARAERAERETAADDDVSGVASPDAGSSPSATDPRGMERAELEAVRAEYDAVGSIAASLVTELRDAAERLERSLDASTTPDDRRDDRRDEGVASDRRGRDGSRRTPDASGAEGPVRRRPVPVLAGVPRDAEPAVDHLLRSGALVLVDGYNVSMSGWPGLDLESQRHALVDHLEAVSSRVGAEIAVVFDGADVPGVAAERRRSVRVTFSPDGVTADDVLRTEVRRLPTSRQVVVVTSDAEIVRDVRAMGANTVASDAFLAATRR